MQYTTRKIFDLFAEGVMGANIIEVSGSPMRLIENVNKEIQIFGTFEVTAPINPNDVLIDLSSLDLDIEAIQFFGQILDINSGATLVSIKPADPSVIQLYLGSALSAGIHLLHINIWKNRLKLGINYNYQDGPI